MKRILPSLLIYGLLFFLGYTVRTCFQESHYPVLPASCSSKVVSDPGIPEQQRKIP